MIKALWKKGNRLYNQQPLRIRILLSVVALCFIYALYSLFIGGPLQRQYRYQERDIVAVEKQVRGLQEQLDLLNDLALQKQAADSTLSQHKLISDELAILDNHLELMITQILNPKQMVNVLSDVLSEVKGIQLVRLTAQPPKPLVEPHEWIDAGERKDNKQVYKDGIDIQFVGNYFDTLAFMRKLETLPSRFFWETFKYRVEKYPNAKVHMVVHYISQ